MKTATLQKHLERYVVDRYARRKDEHVVDTAQTFLAFFAWAVIRHETIEKDLAHVPLDASRSATVSYILAIFPELGDDDEMWGQVKTTLSDICSYAMSLFEGE